MAIALPLVASTACRPRAGLISPSDEQAAQDRTKQSSLVSDSRAQSKSKSKKGRGKANAAFIFDESRCSSDGRRSHQVDLDHDGQGDLVTMYEKSGGDGGERIVCKQADFNFDGHMDAFFYYAENGDVEREQFDQDFDGRIDVGRFYEDGLLKREEHDMDRDGFTDTWQHYDAARLLRVESDRDRDGRADMFVHYVGGQIDRVGFDTDGDGKVDSWDHDAARRARMALGARGRASGDQAAAAKKDGSEYVQEPGAKPPGAAGPDPASAQTNGDSSTSVDQN